MRNLGKHFGIIAVKKIVLLLGEKKKFDLIINKYILQVLNYMTVERTFSTIVGK